MIVSEQAEVILNVAGEGGGYTILGDQNKGNWRFWRKAGGGDDWMFDDEDGETFAPSPRMPAPQPTINYFDTLDEVLQEINRCWPTLHPIQVHPDFSQNIWNRAVRYWSDKDGCHNRSDLESWIECCHGSDSASLYELVPVQWDLPAHWHDFANALRLTLAQMQEDQFLILLCKGSNRFVQFASQYDCMRAEAISNNYLSRQNALSPKDIKALRQLGWHLPTGTPEQATPECDPNGSPNFFMEVPIQHDYTNLVTLAIKTLSMIMGAPHDGYLVYQSFDMNGGDASFPGLGIKRELQDPDLSMAELADRMLNVMKEITGCATLDFDDDGDVPVEFEGQSCLVRLVGQPPMIRFYLPLLTIARPGKALWESLNQLNVGGPVRHFWANDSAYAMLDIPAWPLQARHVETSLALFASVASKSALWLQSEFGIHAIAMTPSDTPH